MGTERRAPEADTGTDPVEPEVRAFYHGGHGEPMVLIHGIGGSWRNWLGMLPALEQGHEVLAVGLLGHHPERAFADGVPPSMGSLVDGVEREMEEAGFEDAHIVGNSLGGWIALELAKRGRARTLVLLSPAGGYERRSPTAVLMAVRLLIENRIVSHGGARLESAVRRPRLRRLLLWGAFARPEQISAYEGLLLLRSFGGAPSFMALLRALGRDGPVAGLEDVSVPVMIAWGTRDRVLPSRYFAARLRDGIPGAEYRELPGLGHVSMVDDPALVADLVLGFRERHRDSAHAVTNARPAAQAGPSS